MEDDQVTRDCDINFQEDNQETSLDTGSGNGDEIRKEEDSELSVNLSARTDASSKMMLRGPRVHAAHVVSGQKDCKLLGAKTPHGDSGERPQEDREFQNEMRGWPVTVRAHVRMSLTTVV